MIEDVQHRIVFIESNLESGIGFKRYVSENDAQSDRNEEQWLKIFLDCQPDKEDTDGNHYDVSYFCIGKASICQKVEEVIL